MSKPQDRDESKVVEQDADVKVVKKKLVLERKVVTGLKVDSGITAGDPKHGSRPWC